MATYKLRFESEWFDKLDGVSRFEILERDYTGNAETMLMQEDPLDLMRGTLENKFKPTIGSGIELRVEAAYDGQYIALYTKDKQKFKGKFYKNGQLIWTGFLNSEVYSEAYDRVSGYPVSLQFNDGFTVLERLDFLQSNGERYMGLKTQWDVLWIILNKLDIQFKYIYLALDIYEKAMNVAYSPLHQTQVDCSNYYDEKGDPKNCREVLESILQGQRAICFQNEACLNIVAVPLLAKDNFVRRQYTAQLSVDPIPEQTVSPLISIPTQADWDGMDQSIDIMPGYNKATLKYSPYASTQVVELGDFSDTDLWEGSYSWEDVGEFYELQGVSGLKGWTLLNGAEFTGTKVEEVDDGGTYIKVPFGEASAEQVLIQNEGNGAVVTGISTQGFKLKFKLYIATKDDEFDTDEEAKMVMGLKGYFVVEVDGKRPTGLGTDPWEWTVHTGLESYGVDSFSATLADQWQNVEVLIPGNCPNGKVSLRFLKKTSAIKKRIPSHDPVDAGTIKHLRIKDIEVLPVDLVRYTAQNGRRGVEQQEPDYSDIEFVAHMDDDWLNEADDVEMILGDSRENNSTDRGGLHLMDGTFTDEWKATGDTQYYNIAELVLRSHVSNYRDSLRQLSGTLAASNFFNGNGVNLDGILSFHSVVTCPNSTLGTKRMMFMGGTYNDKKQTLKGTWLEVLTDDLTINN
jgi:hypothetical protein